MILSRRAETAARPAGVDPRCAEITSESIMRERNSAVGGSDVRRTERLVLVPITTDDLGDLVDLHSDDGISAWYGGTWTLHDAGRFAAAMEDRWQTDRMGKWLAYDQHSGRLIGRGGPTRTDVVAEEAVEIGWAIRRSCWRLGYASEIGRTSIDFVRHLDPGLPIVAFTERHNERSRAVMTRLGMIYSAEIRRSGLIAGREGIHDMAPFALYRLPGTTSAHVC
ncbi:GNAT family N-acetyltransferase [Pseudonocardia tropica]|uniref:GNAT family N-acetyltransferase n=1 Tax=Pseudonocardia tropica TaxID=681289 RepID=A0ABV1JNZ8_9PSEU